MVTQRPTPTFIYLPVFLKSKKTKESMLPDEYVCSAVFKCFQSFKVGDAFLVDKRPSTYQEQQKMRRFKAVKVEYNLYGTGGNKSAECLVELEPITFEDEKKMAAFLNGKHKL